MGILRKITGHEETDDRVMEETPVCPHTSLTPRWRDPDDFGKAEAATYTCESCGEILSYDEARPILDPNRHTPNLPIG